MNRLLTASCLTLALALAPAAAAPAAQLDIFWDQAAGGLWTNAGAWNPATIPNHPIHTATIDQSPGVTVYAANNHTVGELTIGVDNVVRLDDGINFVVTSDSLSGTIDNQGTIEIAGDTGARLQCKGDVTFQGGGQVTSTDIPFGFGPGNWLYSINSAGSITNVDNTISGSLNYGAGFSPLFNSGTLAATNPVNPFRIWPNASGMVNSGTIRADGGTMNVSAGTYTNTGGTIEALDASEVQLATSAQIDGGTLATSGTGVIRAINGAGVQDVTIDGTLQLEGQNDVQGAVVNVGEIRIGTPGVVGRMRSDIPTTLTGGGLIEAANNAGQWIDVLTTGDAITNVDNTIRGAMSLGNNRTTFHNQGIVEAPYATNPLVLDVGGTTPSTNSGTMRAIGGGTLRIAHGEYDNTGGLIEAQDASLVEISAGANLRGGTLQSSGSGVLRTVSSTSSLRDLAIDGVLEVPNGSSLNLIGAIDVTGTIHAAIGGNVRIGVVTELVTLTGGGTIRFDDVSGNRFDGPLGITNESCTIAGSLSLGFNQTPLVNRGTILSDGAVGLSLQPSVAGGTLNEGEIRVNGTGKLLIARPFETSGTFVVESGSTAERQNGYDFVQTGGVTTVDGVLNLIGTTELDLRAGTLAGTGTVSGDVRSTAGRVAPGASPGTLTITGDYTQESGATLALELGGYTPGAEHDVLAVSGDADLRGTVEVALVNGFVPALGDSFAVLTAAGIQDATFSGFDAIGFPGGLTAVAVADGNTLYVVIVSPVDAPEDGISVARLARPLEIRPNPARGGRTTVAFQLHRGPGQAEIAIYDLAGRRVRRLVEGRFGDEVRTATWDGRDDAGSAVAAGIYFVRLTSASGEREVRRVTVMR
ncbi:MAG: FlgD immunoglobulin-like domain containing protein [bacterium]